VAADAGLAERLIAAERDERRRLALFLHDGPVQSLAGIALMLDAVSSAIDSGRVDEAKRVLSSALERQRDTIRSLRDLSFNLEPVVLRDQGFVPAVQGLAERVGLLEELQIDHDVELGETLTENAQVALYQLLREGLDQAVRRGSPTRIAISLEEHDAEIELAIVDDGAGERRRASVEAIEERAQPLQGRVRVEQGPGGGTALRVVMPAYTARS
jgi:two-component system sensor histidine kinase DegS